MKQLLFMVMACYALTTGAQVRQSEDFLYLFNDSVVYANKATLRPNLSSSLQIRADAHQVQVSQIKFINNRDGFFANIGKTSLIRNTSFAERVIEGRVNFFREIPDDLFVQDRWNRHKYTKPTDLSLRLYYNKDFGDLKKVRYDNLMEDMSDNQKSIDLLKGYRKKLNTSKVLYVTAGASLVAGLVSFLATGSNHHPSFGADFGKGPDFGSAYTLLGLGTGLAIGGFVVQMSAYRQLEGAVDAYNR